MSTVSPFLSIKELSLLLNVSSKWCYQHIKDIPGTFRLGGIWFIDREILLAALKEKAVKPHSPKAKPGDSRSRHGLA